MKEGFSEGKTVKEVEEWSKKGKEVMSGFEEDFIKVEKDGERVGWMRVCSFSPFLHSSLFCLSCPFDSCLLIALGLSFIIFRYQMTADKQRFGLKTFTNQDNRDIISDFLTHLHTHRIDFHTSLRHLSTLRPSSSPETIKSFTQSFLSSSIPLPNDEKIKEATRDFIPYFERYCARLNQDEEVKAWEECIVEQDRNGLVWNGKEGGWEGKREIEMLRSNPAFVLRQWVLEELIGKLEDTGVERIEEGRKELARVLDVGLLLSI